MSIPSPLHYIRRKRALRQANKPTAVAKITSRPYINPQTASPLFTVLPAEIRNEIFHYALLSFSDLTCPYTPHSYYYRPGYTHARTIATNLLLTCRRIYLETHLLPLTINEHVIWATERSRWPPNVHTYSYLIDGRMKASQRSTIQYIHLFAQQFWLEDWKDQWLSFTQSWPDGFPPRLKITIRHTDWWYNLLGERWPLALDPKKKSRARAGEWVGEDDPFEAGSWGSRFQHLKGLQIFELELETVEDKKAELDAVVAKAPTWKFPLGGDENTLLIMDPEATEKSSWVGSRHFKGLNAPRVEPRLQLQQGRRATFSSLRGSRSEDVGEENHEELGPGDYLEYYVVTMTWRATMAKAKPLINGCMLAGIRDRDLDAIDGVSGDDEEPASETREDETANETAVAAAGGGNGGQVAPQPQLPSYNRLNALPTYYG